MEQSGDFVCSVIGSQEPLTEGIFWWTLVSAAGGKNILPLNKEAELCASRVHLHKLSPVAVCVRRRCESRFGRSCLSQNRARAFTALHKSRIWVEAAAMESILVNQVPWKS